MEQNLTQRAHILIQQNKFKEAKTILSELVSKDPNNALTLAMLSEVYYQLDDLKQAKELINTAISLLPSDDHNYFIKARIELQLEEYKAAEESLNVAVSMNPGDANYLAFWAFAKLSRKNYKEALDYAERSLEIDPENILGLNTRATALLKLDKPKQAFNTIENALKEDPNNAHTHTNYGWSLLEKGDKNKALEHFTEALKIDPNYEYAQAGMVQALKAKYLIYNWFLKYAFWMSNMTSKYQWGFIIGFYLLFQFLKNIAKNNEILQPLLVPVLFIFAIVAFSTWVIQPISNLFLRLNKHGKYLLKKREITSSNFVGVSALVFLIGLFLYLISGDYKWLSIAAFGFAMMVPFSVMLYPSKYKYSLPVYTIVMFLIGITSIAITFQNGLLFNLYSTLFIFGFLGFQFVANFLIMKNN